jgi:hypothetical protein
MPSELSILSVAQHPSITQSDYFLGFTSQNSPIARVLNAALLNKDLFT